MAKERVLFLPSWYPEPSNPLNGIYVHEQAVLMSNQYDVVVIMVQPVRWWRLFREQIGWGFRKRILDGLSVYVIYGWIMLPRSIWFTHNTYKKAVQRCLEKLMPEWGMPDLIHAHVVSPMGYVSVILGQQYNIPVVLTEHSSPFSMHLKTSYQRRRVVDTLRKTSKVLAVSPSLAQTIQSFVPDVMPEVVGNLVRTDYFSPSSFFQQPSSSQPMRFLTVGFLVEQKGISILIDAVALLRRRGITQFEVIIGGDGKLRGNLEKQAKQLHVNKCCKFVGLLTRSQVRDEIRQCDVFILPSLHETFGIVLAEAMACGKPVIATRCGGPEYFVSPEAGLLVEPADPVVLADAMEAFIRRTVHFNAETIRANVVQSFGEKAFLSKMSNVYEQVLRARNS